ncbi:MAG TPA: hypothetical protein VGN57_01590 [Pirellulaceae bacterium]|jgi:hypothetical protein|nr:hypothetical protein [Pirellulaceae bacterium]
MKSLALSPAGYASVDDEDFERVKDRRWWLHPDGYAYTEIKSEKITLHRFLMDAKPGQLVDHVQSEEKLNCCRDNMRFATFQQNAANRKKWKDNGSPYKGTRLKKGKWIAEISYNRQHYHLASCDNAEDAALYYDVAAQLCFGEFARINGV